MQAQEQEQEQQQEQLQEQEQESQQEQEQEPQWELEIHDGARIRTPQSLRWVQKAWASVFFQVADAGIDLIVCDEAHKLKNDEAQRFGG